MTEETKKKRIKAEIERLKQYFLEADANKRAIVEPLIENAAFMRITLEEMQEIINRDGTVDSYTNGKHQGGTKASAAVQGYNSLVKNYAAVIKTLLGLVPLAPRFTADEDTETEEEREKRIQAEIEQDRERMRRINAEIEQVAALQREQWAKEGRKPI